MTTYTDVFGTDTVSAAVDSYNAFTMGSATTLYWPEQYDGVTGQVAARILEIDVTDPSTLTLPPANQVSVGEALYIYNDGDSLLTVHNNGASEVATIASGTVRILYVTDNSTAAGVWASFAVGSGASAATATDLAGSGLEASAGKLRVSSGFSEITATPYTLSTTDRGRTLLLGSGSATIDLTGVSGATETGFYCFLRNDSTSEVVLDPGAVTINGEVELGLLPGESCLLAYSSTYDWVTIGLPPSTEFVFYIYTDTSVASGSITSNQIAGRMLVLSGANTRTMTLPDVQGLLFVMGDTSLGLTTVTLQSSVGGETVTVTANQSMCVWLDGAGNVYNAINTINTTTSSISLVDGSAAAPSLKFSNAPSTGLFLSAANTVGLTTNGVSRIEVDGEGRIGFSGPVNVISQFSYAGNLPSAATIGVGSVYSLTVPAAVTGTAIGQTIEFTTGATALTSLTYYLASAPTTGAGTVTSCYGFRSLINNSASITNAYNIYASGTAGNYFAGSVGVGVTPAADTKFYISGNAPVSSTNSYAVKAAPSFTSGYTGGAVVFRAEATFQGGAGVTGNHSLFSASDAILDSTTLAGSLRGLSVSNNLRDKAATVYGVLSAINTGSSANYNFYASGTAPNYFAGDMQLDKTITAAATTGAQTINKNAGSVNFATAATSLVVTNSRVTANSVIIATVATNDTTMKSVSAVAASGSFTLYANAAATAETRVNFLVIN